MSFGCSFDVGDIVFWERWKLCFWEVSKLECHDIPNSRDAQIIATLKLLGGQALPPDCYETMHVEVSGLVPAERFLNEMEVLAWAAQETRRTG